MRDGRKNGKRRALALLAALLTALCACAFGEEQPKTAEAFGLTIDLTEEILDFDREGVDVTDAAELSALIERMPRLREVRMFNSTMAQEDMEKLFDTYYPDIFFGFTIHISVHTIRTDQTAFSTLHYSSPKNGDPRHTSEELYALRMCTKLQALDLGHNYLTDLNFLNFMPDIEVLIISPNYGLTDISPIANCRKLVYLECFNTPITDISALAGMTHLRDLNLTRCGKVLDLSPLYDLPNLERFWWGHMDLITKEQKQKMRELHPDCKFVSTYNPTEGGWRKHPHHKEQQAFFRTGVYVPFQE